MDTLWNSTHSFAKVLESFMLLIRTIIRKALRLNLVVVLKHTICAKCMSNTNCAPLEYLCASLSTHKSMYRSFLYKLTPEHRIMDTLGEGRAGPFSIQVTFKT